MLEQLAHLHGRQPVLGHSRQGGRVHEFVQRIPLGRCRAEQGYRVGLRVVGSRVLPVAGVHLPAG